MHPSTPTHPTPVVPLRRPADAPRGETVKAVRDALPAEARARSTALGVAYFAELDTDMTSRGFGTKAAKRMLGRRRQRVAPLSVGIDAIEAGIARRSRHVVAPRWVGPLLPVRMAVQRAVEPATQRGLADALAIARDEHAPLTTPQEAV